MFFRLIQYGLPGLPVRPKKLLSCCPQTSMPNRALCFFFCACRTGRAAEIIRAGVIVQHERSVVRAPEVVRRC